MKTQNQLVFILGLMGFCTNGDIYAAAPMVINIAKDLHITIDNAAMSMTSYMFAFGIFTIFLGPLGDRYGRRNILLISSFATAIFSCLSIFANNLPVLIVLRFINGAFAAGVMPISMAVIGGMYNEEERQGAVAKVMGMMFLGGASGTIIGGAISYFSSWQVVYFVYGTAELLIAFFLLKYLKTTNGTVQKLNYIKLYGKALKNKRLIILLLVIMLSGFSVFGSFTFSGEMIKQNTGLNVLNVGIILSFFGVFGIIGSKLISRLNNGKKRLVALFAGIIGFLSIISISYFESISILIIAISGYGVTFVCMHSINVARAQGTIPELQGTIMSLISFCVFLGSGLGTMLYKQLMTDVSIEAIFYLAAIILLIIGIATFLIVKK